MKNKKILFIIPIVLLFLLIGMLLFVPPSRAIYTDSEDWDYPYSSGKMYISSDRLASDSLTTYENYYDFNNILFHVYNYLNDGQVSSNTLNYDILCTTSEGWACYVDEALGGSSSTIEGSFECVHGEEVVDADEATCDTLNYTYRPVKRYRSHRVKVVKVDSSVTAERVIVNLELNVTYPFAKKLLGNIVFHINHDSMSVDNVAVTEVIRDGDNTCSLLVENRYAEDKNVCLGISGTNNYFDASDVSAGQYCVRIAAGSSRKVLLYKRDSSVACSVNNLVIDSVN